VSEPALERSGAAAHGDLSMKNDSDFPGVDILVTATNIWKEIITGLVRPTNKARWFYYSRYFTG